MLLLNGQPIYLPNRSMFSFPLGSLKALGGDLLVTLRHFLPRVTNFRVNLGGNICPGVPFESERFHPQGRRRMTLKCRGNPICQRQIGFLVWGVNGSPAFLECDCGHTLTDLCPLPTGYIQACRGLMIAAICLGFFGSIFALVGMRCTRIGGSDGSKAKIACLAGVNFVLSGKLSEMVSQSLNHKCLNPVIRPLLRPLLAHRLLPVRTPHHNRVFWPYVCGTEVRAAARAFHVPLRIKR